ncbi:MAG: HD domain-containing protein [Nanoarchaeota archaeon]|nr:HD domain-containing protein [Nanoarchaeota archaeon]MBU1445418.1 HD domain-containing protein [Nanoarchaeota archaeon]MBU2406381.1 HD domain-containing protein [Nanoarchaeota archaeon]MBU2420898.1 HD domain-containing protein [Nanoarchaeota archaeon]MBU2475053.1 HD domain-containing protein [Nanoarchaeota archaeon]
MISNKVNPKYNWDLLMNELSKSSDDKTGHCKDHSLRVLKIALDIADSIEKVDYNVLVVACILHDISFSTHGPKGHAIKSAELAEPILVKAGFSKEEIEKIKQAITRHDRNFSTKKEDHEHYLIEEQILCDADRIDGLGAIGIIRGISFGINHGRPYFVSKEDELNDSIYGSMKTYTKTAKIMFTKKGKELAKERCKIMNEFLVQLEKEFQ